MRLNDMRVNRYCQASAIEAAGKANDPSLSLEARVEWARISKVWRDISRHYDLIGDAPEMPAEVSRRVNETLH